MIGIAAFVPIGDLTACSRHLRNPRDREFPFALDINLLRK
jgi:hypothetical protein